MPENRLCIEQSANRVLEQVDFQNNSAVEIVELAKAHGFFVGETEFNEQTDGMILVNMTAPNILGYETQKVILVRKDLESSMKRFVIAHELGHYFLDRDKDKNNFILAHRDHKVHIDDEKEKAMDFFAACLLMPKKMFIQVKELAQQLYGSSDQTRIIRSLAVFFQVPERSVERRMEEIME